MNISDELLDKYFKNKCTPKEKLLVAKYLLEIEELSAHHAPQEEWDDAMDFPLSNEKSDLLFEQIKSKTFQPKKLVKWQHAIAIAATLLVLISVGLVFYNQAPSAKQIAKIQTQKRNSPAVITWKSTVNYTNRIQDLTLPDQSQVKIYPGGEIRYAIPFVNARREIYLNGKSFFQVTKDKKHPFVVYAKGVSTTALGTSFTIIANNNSKLIQVKLHTGKVWVKDIDSADQKSIFSKILLPGNELVFNRITKNVNIVLPQTMIAKKETKTELYFAQTPIAEVFTKLEQHYKVKINYTLSDVEEISFTGKLNLHHPLNEILKEITELNKLNQEKLADAYLIKKIN